ncbi:hypothetical protein D3Z60_18285 [Lachnospiraceae bacterium]|nr:hypothetical protein [Lachnospiraceae bacterium]
MKIRMEVLEKMRLYNTYYICKQCRDIIKGLSFTSKGQTYKINNWFSYREALFTVRQIDIFSESVDIFYETVPVFVREKEEPEIDADIRSRLLNLMSTMVKEMDVIIELYESINDSENEKGIDVKIPPCDSLEQYISYLKEINFIFSQCPFLQHKDGTIKFKTVDVGSQWLSFAIMATTGTAVVTYILKNLAILVDKTIQIKSHIKNIEQQEEVLRAKKLQNDVLESTLEGFRILKKHYYEEAVDSIEAENKDTPLKDGEERGKVEKCMEKLGELLDKGVEIYASIDTGKDIQVLFPALQDKVELSDSVIKYIEDKQNSAQ